ncbi:hypothetical protein PGT21_014697 [Puccinia graminis f. sp. tritici]|uniref:TEA domain-containing protein n=1 Tax=Puccinia graminis f. sp. tritici TaxID=56615 RepID=A0A5B0R1A1_PUCGR|nr:hypothetical protein PGT21_014697 [Puccinia graminis f. sp. tritici]
MTSYDFFASCSTPKRQRTSNERERLVEIPIEGPSRRKTPAYLDLNGCDFLSMSGSASLPFDSPTASQSFSKKENRSATYFPDFDNLQALLLPQANFNENFRSEVGFGIKSVPDNVLRINRAELENVEIPFNLGTLEYHLKNVPQPPAVLAENLIRAEPIMNGSQNYFLEERWFNENIPKTTPESSSYPPLTSLSSSSDCNPITDFEASLDTFSSTSNFHLSPTHHENNNNKKKRCAEEALEDPSMKQLTHGDLNLMDSGSNLVDNDLKNLFIVPMLSLHVTNNLREAENIVNMIRCEATKRQLYSKDRDIWSEEASRAFDEAIRVIPRLGRAKILALTPEGRKPFGRNELIADYIYRRTGIVRHRKQVSSHIQVIKNSKKFEPLAELLDQVNQVTNMTFDQCSASWFGAYLSKDVLVLYPCTPEFPFPSRTLQHHSPPQNQDEFLTFLDEVALARHSKPFP